MKTSHIITAILLLAAAEAAMAAAGVSQENLSTFLDEVLKAVKGCGKVVASIAAIMAGYRLIWGGYTIEQVRPLFIGGLIVGYAAWIAGVLVTGNIA